MNDGLEQRGPAQRQIEEAGRKPRGQHYRLRGSRCRGGRENPAPPCRHLQAGVGKYFTELQELVWSGTSCPDQARLQPANTAGKAVRPCKSRRCGVLVQGRQLPPQQQRPAASGGQAAGQGEATSQPLFGILGPSHPQLLQTRPRPPAGPTMLRPPSAL